MSVRRMENLFSKLLSLERILRDVQQRSLSHSVFAKRKFGEFEFVVPGKVIPDKLPPPHVKRPPYAESGEPPAPPPQPEILVKEDLENMRNACALARKLLNDLHSYAKVGRTTEDLNAVLYKDAVDFEAYPSPLNYRHFPKSICTSVNNVACHGIPDDRPLADGDILTVDVTVYVNGFHGDCAETFLIGKVDAAGRALVSTTYQALIKGIYACGPGVPFSAIGANIQEVVEQAGLTVVPAFTGHGVGSYFHGPPEICHFRNTYPGTMKEGMIFTIEPVVAQGAQDVVVLEDGWTACMEDGGRAAQAEQTIRITDVGFEILTDPE